jgi:phosphate transport system substrate-binding protein
MRSSYWCAAVLIAAVLCGSAAFADTAQRTTIRVQGTVILQPLFAAAAKRYMQLHPNVTVIVQGTSSGAGISALKDGSADIAGADVHMDMPDFTETRMALSGLAFIVGPGTGVTNITQDQAVKIFSGKITNWRQLGGNDLPIVLMERAVGGGTRFIFEQTVAKTTVPVQNYPDPSKMAEVVNRTPGALSYVAAYFVQQAHSTAISYNGIAPTDANIADGTYQFVGHETAYSAKPPNADLMAFLEFVRTDTGDFPAAGLIPPQR